MPAKEQRPTRMCDVCGGVDDHPRHVFAHAPGDGQSDYEVGLAALDSVKDDPEARKAVLDHLKDNATTMRHMDCCREAGCPDGTCNQVTAGAENKKGDALVKHLTSQKVSN